MDLASLSSRPLDFEPTAAPAGRSRPETPVPDGTLVVDDAAIEPAPRVLVDFATAPVNVLVVGETGAGKEVLAQRIHALSGRSGRLVAVNCAALSEALLESELFGHEQGAFTGATRAKAGLLEAANGGTIFLDEIGELPPGLQPKLLRAIEAREVLRVGAVRPLPIDVRFVAATHRDLVAEVAARRFRADLYYRLDGVTIHVAPLRANPARIVPLALRFIAAARRARGDARPPTVTAAFRARLERHDWPGNVRELKAACERAAVLASGGPIDARHLVVASSSSSSSSSGPSVVEPARIPETAAELSPAQLAERARIVAALAAQAGNQRRAATELGMSRSTLATRLVLYRIPRPRDR